MTLKRTPLFAEHQKLKAKLVEFGGWEMPVLYTNLIEEHVAVRTHVGMFDAGHMGVVQVTSDKWQAAKEAGILTREISDMKNGQVRYNRLVNDTKGLVDDILVYRNQHCYFCVFNASNVQKDMTFLNSKGITTKLLDYHIIAVQGPDAEKLLQKHADIDLSAVKYYNFAYGTFDGRCVIWSRTGYTGEKGFEIMAPANDNAFIWDALIKDGIMPCGLGARDTLRVEAGMPLYGHEMKDEWTNEESNSILGLKMLEKAIPRQGYPILDADRTTVIGEVTSGTFSPSLQQPIGLVRVTGKKIGDEVFVQVRQNIYKGMLVKPAFINNTRT
jgi:aminomethyltransferase